MAQAQLQTHNPVLLAVAEVAGLLGSLDPLPQIPRALALLGQALGADRVYLSEAVSDPAHSGTRYSQHYEWCAPGIPSEQSTPRLQNMKPYPAWLEALKRGEAIRVRAPDFPEAFREDLRAEGIRSLLEVPILIQGQLWGFLGFDDYTEERLWTEEEATILRIAATSFGQAVQRAQAEAALLRSQERSRELLGEAERQARQLALLQEVQQAVARDLELPALFKHVTEVIAQSFRYDLVSVYRLEGETLVLEHQIGYPEVIHRLPIGQGVMGRVARTGQAALLEDATQDPDFLAAFPGIRSEVCVPLERHGQIIGVLNVESTPQTLGVPDLELMRAVAVQLGLALERADLYASLKQSETLYRTLVETSPDGVWLLDSELRLVYGNTRLLKALGAPSLEAILGRSALELVHPEAREEVREMLTALIAGQERVRFTEQKHLRLDGGVLEADVAASRIQDPTSGKPMILGISRDIAARKRAQEALRQSEERYRALVETSPDAVRLVDREGKILYANPCFLRMVGAQSPEEVLGRSVFDFIHPDHRPPVAERFQKVLEGEAVIPFLEQKHLRLDGSVYDVEVGGAVIRDPRSGEPVLQAISRDISVRKRAEEALRESEERFRAMADNAPVMVWVTEPDGVCSFLNQPWYDFTGQTPGSGLGYGWLEAIHPDDREPSEQIFFEANRRREPFRLEYRLRRQDGEYRWAIDSARPRFGPGGEFLGYVGSVLDITERKQTEEALKESEERLRSLYQRVPVGLYRTTPQGQILEANPAFLEMLGYASLEELREVNSALLYADPSERPWRLSALEHDPQVAHELQLRRKDGSTLWVQIITRAAKDALGKILYYEGSILDISERRQAEEALRQREARFRALVQHSQDITEIVDQEGRVLYVSPNVQFQGYDPEYWMNHPVNILDYLHPEDQGRGRALFERLLSSPGASLSGEFRGVKGRQAPGDAGTQVKGRQAPGDAGTQRRPEGGYTWFEVLGQNLLHDPDVGGIVLSLRNISERKHYQAQIEHLAYHDALTGLPNRRMLTERAEWLLALALREQSQAALGYLDVDGFKEINDSLGHAAGDELLRQVAERMQAVVRSTDTLVRLGGDEFALLLPNVDEEGALEAAGRMLGALEAPFWIAGQNVYLTASLGLALFPRDGKNLDELMRSADVAMYQAKQNRTRIAFHQAELNPYTRERLGLITDLRQALSAPQTGGSADPHGQFRLHYQPILKLKSGRFGCYEALIRWQHPHQGLIGPSQFVPLAETAGMIRDLDRWALAAAIQDSKQMNRAVSVNLSAKTLSEAGLAQTILGLLAHHSLRPSQLWLEVTETALMEKQGQSAANLETLARAGVRIALDDFGTGYSSLAYLKHLPVQVLKIDRSFVGGIGKHADEEIALSILRLADSLGLATLAEGVETPEQLEWLRQAGCDYAQGYHIQRPVPREELG